jgi:hypothetical protein
MTEITDDERQRTIDAIYAGRKIDAIKIYRQATNCDLVTAKSFVEQLETRLRAEHPEEFTAAAAKGCGGQTALIVGMMVALLAGGMAIYRVRIQRPLPAPPVPHVADNVPPVR